MKKSILMLAITASLVSCGKSNSRSQKGQDDKPRPRNGIQLLEEDSKIAQMDRETYLAGLEVCNSLKNKREFFNDINDTNFTFETENNDCGIVTTEKDIQGVLIAQSPGNFYFYGDKLNFTDVLTDQSPSISKVCENIFSYEEKDEQGKVNALPSNGFDLGLYRYKLLFNKEKTFYSFAIIKYFLDSIKGTYSSKSVEIGMLNTESTMSEKKYEGILFKRLIFTKDCENGNNTGKSQTISASGL